jgi:myosin heavy subunit
MKVDFNSKYTIHGCEIINYLLEKSRVVTQSDMERNYHIFYQLICGADKEMKDRLYLENVADYSYLDQSGMLKFLIKI